MNLAGRPVLDAAAGTVTLADVTFPPVSNKENTGKFGSTTAADLPRLGTEPFASIFAGAAKLDVSRALTEALPRATQLLSQRIGDDVTLTAKLKDAVPVSLEIASDGAWLLVDLTGELSFAFDGVAEKVTSGRVASATSETPVAATTSTVVAAPATTKRSPVAKRSPANTKRH